MGVGGRSLTTKEVVNVRAKLKGEAELTTYGK